MTQQSDFDVVVNRRKKGFTQVYNHFLEDVTLSWKAKGIFIYILSRPHGWKLNIKGDVSKRSTDKERAIYSGIKELVDRGYISRTRNSDFYITYHFFEFVEDNNIPDYLLSREQNSNEIPHSQNAHVQNADSQNAHVQNSNDLIRPKDSNTECSNTQSNNNGDSDGNHQKSKYSEQFERWWSIYPRKQGKGKAYSYWKRDKLDKRIDELLEKLQQQNKSEYAFTEIGYIPHGSTYLNESRYDDDVIPKGGVQQLQRGNVPQSKADQVSAHNDAVLAKWLRDRGLNND